MTPEELLKRDSLQAGDPDADLAAFAGLFQLLAVDELPLRNPTLAKGAAPRVEAVTTLGGVAAGLSFAWSTGEEARAAQLVEVRLKMKAGLRLEMGPVKAEITERHLAAARTPGNGHVTWIKEYAGSLQLSGTTHVNFTAEEQGQTRWRLAVDFTAGQTGEPPGLRDLAGLLGLAADGHAADLQFLPPELQSADLVSLGRLEALIDPAEEHKLTFVSVGLVFLSGRTWQAIPGLPWLRVGNLRAELQVEHPLDSAYRFPRITLSGTVELGAQTPAHLDLSARWPDLAIKGELRKPDRITVAALLGEMGIPTGDLPPALAITDLGFLAEPDMAKKQFSFHAAVENVWALDLPGGKSLAIENLGFRLAYHEGGMPSFTPEFFGTLVLGGLEVNLYAGREGDGWRFSGGTETGSIPVGEWIEKLAEVIGSVTVPAPVAGAKITQVEVSLHTGTRDLQLSMSVSLPVDGKELDLVLTLDCTKHGGNYEKKFAGAMKLGWREFDLNFQRSTETDSGKTQTLLTAAYHNEPGDSIRLADVLGAAGVEADGIPDLSLTLKSAVFALDRGSEETPAWKVFGVNIDGGLNLSGLPLLGKLMPPGQSVSVDFQAVYSSEAITVEDASKRTGAVNALLPPGATPLPAGALIKGVSLSTKLRLGSEVIPLALPVSMGSGGMKNTTAPPAGGMGNASSAGTMAQPVAVGDSLKWFSVHKAFGPVHFERIGAACSNGKITLALDAALVAGGLTLSLDGLALTSPLTKLEPSISLRGLGLSYASGPLEVGGSFLRLGPDEFAGTALIRTKTFTLSAIGAYKLLETGPSLFVYAVLDYPLGGPSFFFVTGLAAGFGYNRSLIMPAIGDVETFPLVDAAVRGAGMPGDVMEELKKLGRYVPPDNGQYFLAVGVKFNSFKIIDSFALIAVSFGHRFEIDVLGLSTLVVPAPLPGAPVVAPLARLSIALMARFIPDEGLLAVDARIMPDSYLFDPKCHLSGGFAFYSWFSGPLAGDFVITLGGYHPKFKPPAHYPLVPRLGFNWQVVPELVIKGDAYGALTSHALMAGGHLEATYESDRIKAWFKAGADFLISWQPYHYDASIYVDVGGSYRTDLGTISVDVGAQLHIWGPEFAGTAELDLYLFSVTVAFGDQNQNTRPFITWEEFKHAFLPDEQAVLSITVESGLVLKGDKTKQFLGTVNSSTLSIVTNSLIPASSQPDHWTLASDANGNPRKPAAMGVSSVGAAQGTVSSIPKVSVFMEADDSKDSLEISGRFDFTAVQKDMPSAIWGAPTGGRPEANPEHAFLKDAICGVRLTPKPVSSHVDLTHEEDIANLAVDNHHSPLPVVLKPCFLQPEVATGFSDPVRDAMESVAAAETRRRILLACGYDPGAVLAGSLTSDDFTLAPRLTRVLEPLSS